MWRSRHHLRSTDLVVSEFWNNHPASNKCIPKAPTIGITYALGAVNASADWAFGILPFFIVWDIQVTFRTKMLVAGILAFAAMSVASTTYFEWKVDIM